MKITIKEIVGQFLNSSDQSSHQFLRLYNMATWGLKTEFNLDITGQIKTVILDVNGNKTVCLPCDYVDYSKMGIINGLGEIATFRRNDQLSKINSTDIYNTDDRNIDAPKEQQIGFDSFPFYLNNNYFNYWDNGTSYQLFGLDSGAAPLAEYRLDEENKLILLSPDCQYTQIVLEYLSNGYDDTCNDYSVDVRASESMICYLRWNNAKDQKKKFSDGEVRGFKREFYREKRIAKMRLNPFKIPEILDTHIRHIKLTAKA